MSHLVNIAIVALAGLGVWTAMGEGMVLERVRKAAEVLPAFLQKPLATCPRCMVTIYGTSALIVLGLFPSEPFAYLFSTAPMQWEWACASGVMIWPVYLVCAVGLQEMLHR